MCIRDRPEGQRSDLHHQCDGRKQQRRGFFLGQLANYKGSTRALYEAGWRRNQAVSGEDGERSGRFERESGQQVGSFFECSSDNDKIKHIYGNFGLWSWIRYWYLDTANQVTLMLIDKGYYDYDFKAVAKKQKQLLYEDTVKSEEETRSLLARFGIGTASQKEPKDMDMEELQEYAMNDIKQ